MSIEAKDLVDLAEFILKNNYFELESIYGDAIGRKFAPSFANLFMLHETATDLKLCCPNHNIHLQIGSCNTRPARIKMVTG